VGRASDDPGNLQLIVCPNQEEEAPMVVRMNRDSAKLEVVVRPVVAPPVVESHQEHGGGSPIAIFRPQQELMITGEVGFGAERGDSRDGWTVGLIQAGYCVEAWAYYQGEQDEDGSVLVRRDVPPALRPGAFLDCEGWSVRNIFANRRARRHLKSAKRISGPYPYVPGVWITDVPDTFFWTTTVNTRTGKLNYLSEAVSEDQFCTVLSVRHPNNKFDHLQHVYWSLRYHATFHPRTFDERSTDFRIEVAPPRMRWQDPLEWRALDGPPVRAHPLGAEFAKLFLLKSPQHHSFNEMARDAALAADTATKEGPNRQHSDNWQMRMPDRHPPKSFSPYEPLAWRL
jgi:hypothetical protein